MSAYPPNFFIQIAGVKSHEEAQMVAISGATHLGFPFGLDFHTEDTTIEEASLIIRELPVSIHPVLITYYNVSDQIKYTMDKLGCRIVQLHGRVAPEEIQKLRQLLPGIEVWKSLVIHPEKPEDALLKLRHYEVHVDAFITDTFDPDTGASGATGKTHDWKISREIVKRSSKPVIIAGGLNPENVADAIRYIRPAGVDVHTGVENREGIKDPGLVLEFVKNAQKAYSEMDQNW